MIKGRIISVSLGGKEVLRGVDFEAAPNRFTAIVGPNGSGKTTLLRCLSGELVYEGHVLFNNTDLASLSPRQQAAMRGVLSQSSQVVFPFTVKEVVALGQPQTAAWRSPKTHEMDIDARLAQVGLNSFAARRYDSLSGGEQQRVHLARVLHQIGGSETTQSTRWLFLDEPVSSLDIKHQLQVMAVAKSFSQKNGGVIAVMHDLNLTAMFADQIFVMKDGEVAASGTPEEVLRTPIIASVFDCPLEVNTAPEDKTPFVLPQSVRFTKVL
ncbi:MAG: heme ABC transporter ATP-binding protein [Pseudomonadota bacterium]